MAGVKIIWYHLFHIQFDYKKILLNTYEKVVKSNPTDIFCLNGCHALMFQVWSKNDDVFTLRQLEQKKVIFSYFGKLWQSSAYLSTWVRDLIFFVYATQTYRIKIWSKVLPILSGKGNPGPLDTWQLSPSASKKSGSELFLPLKIERTLPHILILCVWVAYTKKIKSLS